MTIIYQIKGGMEPELASVGFTVFVSGELTLAAVPFTPVGLSLSILAVPSNPGGMEPEGRSFGTEGDMGEFLRGNKKSLSYVILFTSVKIFLYNY